MVNMQGVTVLQNMYIKKNNRHLQGHKDKRKRKSQKNRMFGDGMAKLLDDDVFFNKVVEVAKRRPKKRKNNKWQGEHTQKLWQHGRSSRKKGKSATRRFRGLILMP